MHELLTPHWLIRLAVAGVWLYEGVWCKLLGREKNQLAIVGSVPYLSPGIAGAFLKVLGAGETFLALWVLSGVAPVLCAAAQTLLILTLNVNGLLFAARLIHDPGGMVVKNFAYVVLVWVAASLPPWR